jgi:hypothetical protein
VLKLSWFNWYFGASWLLMNSWTIYAAIVSRKDKASAAVSAWAVVNIQTLLLYTFYRWGGAARRAARGAAPLLGCWVGAASGPCQRGLLARGRRPAAGRARCGSRGAAGARRRRSRPAGTGS